MAKKNEFIITVGFNQNDPEHQEAVRILNSMNRTKAQYIVKAVLAYQRGLVTANNETVVDYEKIRAYVLQVMEEHKTEPDRIKKGETEEKDIDKEAVDGIMMSLNSFRHV